MFPYHPHAVDVQAMIEFVNEDDNALATPFVSASYEILDEEEMQLSTATLSGADLSSTNYSLTISAADNTLVGDETISIRSIVMTVMDANNVTTVITERYYIEFDQTLKTGVNSMMTFSKSLALRPTIPLLEGWDAALDDRQRKAALIEAYQRLGRFRLSSTYNELTISAYDVTGLSELDSRIVSDFRKAQLIEANALLGGEQHHDRRIQGIMSESTGESTTFYRTRMALNRGISSKAYAYIVRYLDNTVIAGRSG